MNKKKYIKFRVDSLEKAVIEKNAENSGLSVSAFCRNTSIGKKVSSKLTEKELEAYRDLSQFKADLTRIKNAYKMDDPRINEFTLNLIQRLNGHLNKFR